VMMVVMTATLAVLDSSSRLSNREAERSQAIREAQVGLDRMVRELRHTRVVHSAGAQVIEVEVFRRGVQRRVRYDCSVPHPQQTATRRCVRVPITPAGASEVLVDGLRTVGGSSTVFSYTPAAGPARYVSIRLGASPRPTGPNPRLTPTVIEDGTELRNAGV
jgi:hypothetical protein